MLAMDYVYRCVKLFDFSDYLVITWINGLLALYRRILEFSGLKFRVHYAKSSQKEFHVPTLKKMNGNLYFIVRKIRQLKAML